MEFVVLKHLSRMLVFEVGIFTCEMYQVELGTSCCITKTINWWRLLIFQSKSMDKGRKVNWTKEEEYTLLRQSRMLEIY